MRIAPLLACLALAVPLAAQAAADQPKTIEGRAVALDGDTLLIFPIKGFQFGGDRSPETVRLWGIDAPEMTAENGHGWAARAELDEYLASDGDHVRCTVIDRDRHKRLVAICKSVKATIDLGMWVIRRGWAVEYRKYTRPPPLAAAKEADFYAIAEAMARGDKIGRWALIYGE
jgi:endonuclease YncB( thermonuclease family)